MAATRTHKPNKTTHRRDIRRTWKYVCLHPWNGKGERARTVVFNPAYGLGLARVGSEWFPIMRVDNLNALKEKYHARLLDHAIAGAPGQIEAN